MIILNKKELATSQEKREMLSLIEAALTAVLPKVFMSERIHVAKKMLWVDKKAFSIEGRRIFVVGAGKAGATMAMALEKLLGPERITAGVVISNHAKTVLKKIEILEAEHPIPSLKNVAATQKLLAMKAQHKINKEDLIISLISGGGSALMTYPPEGVSFEDIQEMNRLLLLHGADETELAVVRKKVSRVKGGRLANFFYPSPIVSLVLSDVSTNDLSTIASGPFTPDQSTNLDAWKILEKYELLKKMPPSIIDRLEKNRNNEPVKRKNSHVHQTIIADNTTAKKALMKQAAVLGLHAQLKSNIYGEAKETAWAWCEEIRKQRVSCPTVFLAGSYTSVNLGRVKGKGGRNQEFIVACLEYLKKNRLDSLWCMASIATDGVDFIKDSAGGLIDGETLRKIEEKGVNLAEVLKKHNSHSILKKLKANVFTGDTGTNVCDIVATILKPK